VTKVCYVLRGGGGGGEGIFVLVRHILTNMYAKEIVSTEITNNFDTSDGRLHNARESETAIFEIHHVTSSALGGKEKHVELFCFRPRENK